MAIKLDKTKLCKDSYSHTDEVYLLKFSELMKKSGHNGHSERLKGIAEKNLKDKNVNSFPTQ